MFFPFFIQASENLTCSPFVSPLSIINTVFELTLITVTIIIDYFSFTIHLRIQNIAIVVILIIFPLNFSFTFYLIFKKFACILNLLIFIDSICLKPILKNSFKFFLYLQNRQKASPMKLIVLEEPFITSLLFFYKDSEIIKTYS